VDHVPRSITFVHHEGTKSTKGTDTLDNLNSELRVLRAFVVKTSSQ
jgi:hypothetical protein